MSNIVLIGFMGSGKTTIGRELSRVLDLDFLDSDVFISEKENCSIPEIFRLYGQNFFRSLETNFIHYASRLKNCVIATGGGMPIFCDISHLGRIIFLDVDFESIQSRLSHDTTRPLFDEKAYELFLSRQETYRMKAHITIDANATPDKILESILQYLVL